MTNTARFNYTVIICPPIKTMVFIPKNTLFPIIVFLASPNTSP